MSFEKININFHISLVLSKAASLWGNDGEGGRFCVRLWQKVQQRRESERTR